MPNSLTPRETLIAAMVAEGLTNWEIADRLSNSLSTVKTHIQNIRQKLHIESSTGHGANRVKIANFYREQVAGTKAHA